MMKPNLFTVVMMLSVGGTVTLSGCSRYNKDHTEHTAATLANLQAAQILFDNQASRNNGAWGAVYMSKEELRSPQVNIVDVSSIPAMTEDASMQKWLAKFEGSSQGKTGFITTNGKKLYDDSCAGCHMQKVRAHKAQATIHRLPITARCNRSIISSAL